MKHRILAAALSVVMLFSTAVSHENEARGFSLMTQAVSDTVKIGGKSFSIKTKVLDLSNMGLRNSDLSNIRKMNNLYEVILSGNDLTDLSVLSDLTTLEKVTFHDNNVEDISFVKKLKKLTVIGADNNGIKDISALSGLTKLKEVWMGGNNVKDISSLKKCTKITHINFSGSPLKSINALSGMKNLNTLLLNDCGLKSIKALKLLKKLKYVYIADNLITDLTPLSGSCLIDLYADNNKLKGNYGALEGVTVSGTLSIDGNGFSGKVDLSQKKRKSLLYDYQSKFYYGTMNKRQKMIYRDLYECLEKRYAKKELTLKDVTTEEFSYVWWLFAFENPQFYWANTIYYDYEEKGGTITHFVPVYYLTKKSDIDQLTKKINDQIDKIVTRALKKTSDFEIIVSLHDSLVGMTEYKQTDDYLGCRAAGPLTKGTAQCEGYAQAFMALCQSAGIPCVQINGTTDNQDHAWNRVQIDGKWYNIDATIDDTFGNYSFFCVTDRQIELMDHDIQDWFPISGARAVSKKYNYYRYTGETVYDDADEAYEALIKKVISNYKKGILTNTVYIEPEIAWELLKMLEKDCADDLYNGEVYGKSCVWECLGCVVSFIII